MIGELYMPHYYLGYQQLVVNSEPGSVDSTIDNLSVWQLTVASRQFIRKGSNCHHTGCQGTSSFCCHSISYIGNFLVGQLLKPDRVERWPDTFKAKKFHFFAL
jgi:hypothetical protein